MAQNGERQIAQSFRLQLLNIQSHISKKQTALGILSLALEMASIHLWELQQVSEEQQFLQT